MDLGGEKRLCRQEAGSIIIRKKRRERSSLRAANGSRLTCTTSPPVNHSIIHSFVQSINRHFFVCLIIRACTSTSIHFRRAGQQGPTRTLTAALKRVIKQLLGTYSIEQVKYYKQTRKLEKKSISRSIDFLLY